MRSTSERTGAVLKRTRELKELKRKRRDILTAALSSAACLALISAAALAMPGLEARRQAAGGVTGAEASVFAESAAAGYVLIGILAFALGCCVTILCCRLRRRGTEERHDRDNR